MILALPPAPYPLSPCLTLVLAHAMASGILRKHKGELSLKPGDNKCLLLHVPKVARFVSVLEWDSYVNHIAVGIFSLCNELDLNGFDTEIIHLGIEKYLDPSYSIAQYIKQSGVKLVGMSLHWHFQSYDTIEVARAIKRENPDTFIVLGGYTASCYAGEILAEYPFIDAVIKGEGEVPIVQLAKKVASADYDLEHIPNLYWRKNGRVEVNTEHFVATSEELDQFSFYTKLPKLRNSSLYFRLDVAMCCKRVNGQGIDISQPQFQPFQSTNEVHTVCLGRGCAGNCAWCGGGAKALKKIINRNCISWRSPQKVAEEMFMLRAKYDVRYFAFCFDPTPWERSRLTELFRILGKSQEKIRVFFECFGLPTKEFLSEFKSNLSEDSVIAISPELANEKLRRFYKSFSFTNAEFENILMRMDDMKMHATLFFTDIPGIAKEDSKETANYVKYLCNKFGSTVDAYIFPISHFEPAAPWTENPSKYGIHFERKTFKDFYQEHCDPVISWESPEFTGVEAAKSAKRE